MVSNMVSHLTASVTLALTAKVKQMQDNGVDVLAFNLGEPDFATPAHIIAAAKRAMDEGHTHYTAVPGILPLRQAIACKLQADNRLHYSPLEICCSTGAKQALFNALVAVLDPGDQVLIPTPCWVSYQDMVTIAGGVPVTFSTLEADGFQIDPARMEAAITGRTKMIILNSPNNPTGCIYTRDVLQGVLQVAQKHGLLVLSDEIYEKLIYTDEPYVSIASLSDWARAHTITVNGFSKAYAMTGWRIGYSAAPLEIAKGISAIQSHTTSNASTLAQYAALAALTGTQEAVGEMRDAFRQRQAYLVERLSRMPGLTCAPASGAFYLMPNITACFGKKTPHGTMLRNAIDLCDYLLTDARIALVPGEAFLCPGNIRISYTNAMDELKEGMDRLQDALAALAEDKAIRHSSNM